MSVIYIRNQVTCTLGSRSFPAKVPWKLCRRWTSAVALKRLVFYCRQWICRDLFSAKHAIFSSTPTEPLSSDTSCSNESDTWNPYVRVNSALNNWKSVSSTSYRQPWVVEFFYRRYLPDLLDILLVRSMARRKISPVMKKTPSRFFVETLATAFIMIRYMIHLSFLEAKEIVWKSWGNGWSLILWHLTKSISIAGENRGNFSFSFSSWLWLQSR